MHDDQQVSSLYPNSTMIKWYFKLELWRGIYLIRLNSNWSFRQQFSRICLWRMCWNSQLSMAHVSFFPGVIQTDAIWNPISMYCLCIVLSFFICVNKYTIWTKECSSDFLSLLFFYSFVSSKNIWIHIVYLIPL